MESKLKILPTWRQFKNWQLPSKYSCLSFFLGSVLSGISVYYAVRPNPDLVALNEALRAEKSTKLELSEASSIRFLGENGYILSLTFENQSNRPAYKLKVKLNGPNGPISTPSNGAFKIFALADIRAEASSKTEILAARVADIESALGVKCIEGFSLKPNLSKEEFANFREVELVPFMVEVYYETVFKEKNTKSQGLWAIVPRVCS